MQLLKLLKTLKKKTVHSNKSSLCALCARFESSEFKQVFTDKLKVTKKKITQRNAWHENPTELLKV